MVTRILLDCKHLSISIVRDVIRNMIKRKVNINPLPDNSSTGNIADSCNRVSNPISYVVRLRLSS